MLISVVSFVFLLHEAAGASSFQHLISPSRRDLERPDRIVGGAPVNRGDIPWQVSLQYKSPGVKQHFCGGTLIRPDWVVTAAHCTVEIDYRNVVAVVGAYNLKEPSTEYSIKNVIRAEFDKRKLINDIALLKLNIENPVVKVVETEENIPQTVSLGTDPDINGVNCTISGWGRLSNNGDLPNILHAAQVEVQSLSQCKKMMTKAKAFAIGETNICAGGGAQDSCQGDSGGPLVCCADTTREVSSCRLIGVVSWGIGCATPGIPGVYTNVAHYVSWINRITKNYE